MPRNIPAARTRTVDDEEAPDMVRGLIDRLRSEKRIDETITEPLSIDWRVEHQLLKRSIDRLAADRSWIPRLAETVLFVRNLTGEINFNAKSQTYQVWDVQQRAWAGTPHWEAGLVAQTADDQLQFEDIRTAPPKSTSISHSGFRIEPLSDVNAPTKTLDSRYTYVPMHHIRPFAFDQEYLRNIPIQDIDETIWNARKAMSSMSLLGRHRFRGAWPSAAIHHRGLYLGSELIVEQDAVRFFWGKYHSSSDSASTTHPTPDTHEHQVVVMHVQRIELQMTGLDATSRDEYDGGSVSANKVVVRGSVYTLNPLQAGTDSPPIPQDQLPHAMHGYGNWYRMHDKTKQWCVPFSKIAGKCFEAQVMRLWHPGHPSILAGSSDDGDDGHVKVPSLDIGLDGIQQARDYATAYDTRIRPDKLFYWGDTRAESLSLQTFNGMEISYHDADRNTDNWREAAHVLEKVDGAEHRKQVRDADVARDEAEAKPKVRGAGAMGLGVRGAAFVPSDDNENPVKPASLAHHPSQYLSEGTSSTADDRARLVPSKPSPVVLDLTSDNDDDGDSDSKTDEAKKIKSKSLRPPAIPPPESRVPGQRHPHTKPTPPSARKRTLAPPPARKRSWSTSQHDHPPRPPPGARNPKPTSTHIPIVDLSDDGPSIGHTSSSDAAGTEAQRTTMLQSFAASPVQKPRPRPRPVVMLPASPREHAPAAKKHKPAPARS